MSTTSETGVEAMQTLVKAIGYDRHNLSVEQKTEIANRLSQIANRSNPWTWRYIHNVLAGYINASLEMMDAIMRLLATLDGAPEVLAIDTIGGAPILLDQELTLLEYALARYIRAGGRVEIVNNVWVGGSDGPNLGVALIGVTVVADPDTINKWQLVKEIAYGHG